MNNISDNNMIVNHIISTGKTNSAGEIRSDCPFCGGKADFTVNANSGVFHCFKCDVKGKTETGGGSGHISSKSQSKGSVSDKAKYMLENSGPVKTHPYLEKKQVRACEGVRLYKGMLLIPMLNDGSVKSVQMIASDGDKKFLTGTQKKGCYFRIDGINSATLIDIEIVYLCEGYATGMSVHMATGATVYIAFDAGNLAAVLEMLTAQGKDVVLCADNDWQQKLNPGLKKAAEAVLKYDNVKLVYPAGIQGTDFNDLMLEKGLEAVKAGIAEAKRPDVKPSLRLSEDIVEQVEYCQDVIRDRGEIYERSGELFRAVTVQESIKPRKKADITRGADSVILQRVNQDWLQWHLNQEIDFRRTAFDKDKKKFAEKKAKCPGDIPRFIMANAGAWGFPYLTGVLNTPTITPEGRIISENGYDDETGLLLKTQIKVNVPENLTGQDVERAKAAIHEVPTALRLAFSDQFPPRLSYTHYMPDCLTYVITYITCLTCLTSFLFLLSGCLTYVILCG